MLVPQPPTDATDIFSLSDQVLGDRLHFIEEIGFGNWGSVWLCRPKGGEGRDSRDDVKLAVKLVHRSKTTTTAARVRSLWNEMKIVRTFKNDPHPSIVPFHSFIITPSYALITMDFLPTLVPVDVAEPKAKEWFRSLLSGVHFLHKRGVVHNDIKPANILLSYEQVPVLVDFGFAEKYDMKASKAFHSNLTYGTPEYLSPERARGLPHDTRKSDIWSLGITFFEILIGRTPFEHEEGEQFTTKEDLEKYWARTMRGKWVGTWKMSKGAERLLRRMIQPNADLRCNASEAMADAYWAQPKEPAAPVHKKSASVSYVASPSQDGSKLLDIISPWSTRRLSKDLKERKPKIAKADKENAAVAKKDPVSSRATHARSQSQPRVLIEAAVPTKKRVPVPSGLGNLASIRGSPPSTPVDAVKAKKDIVGAGKENAAVSHASAVDARRPFGARKPVPLISRTGSKLDLQAARPQRKVGAPLTDLTGRVRNADTTREGSKHVEGEEGKSMGSVRDRMREWERERERLREMERVKEGEVAGAEEHKKEQEDIRVERRVVRKVSHKSDERLQERTRGSDQANRNAVYVSVTPTESVPATPISPDMQSFFQDQFPRTVSQAGNESGLSILKQSFKLSIDKTMHLYKSSTRFSRKPSESPSTPPDVDVSRAQSWEDEDLIKEANSSLPAVRNAVRNARAGADSRADRMTIWIQNVEKVVEDARQNFASSSVAHLPPLPIAPVSRSTSRNRSNRSSRLPRKILAASQIFHHDGEQSFADQSYLSASTPQIASRRAPSTPVPEHTLPVIPSEEPSRAAFSLDSPRRMRRATVFGSPEKSRSMEIETGSPSKRKEKSKSQNDLQRAISPVSKLTFELERLAQPSPPMRLSAVVDRNLFIAEPVKTSVPETPAPSIQVTVEGRTGHDSLTASPFVVQPYPPRERATASPTIDSPTQRRVEGVYDRFLMATSGVKRVGRGYQSDNIGPISNTPVLAPAPSGRTTPGRIFHSTRRVMPPPVSSEDQRKTLSVDELGVMVPSTSGTDTPCSRDERPHTVRNVTRALKAIVTGKTVVKKHPWV
ncbi:hypothetical protein BV25DRAFT_1916896 [Artomyces pyxidatus]|uniref:Uncharacterized protein n=1 Tax=Artomyces pyxidatus TaxID=48021 RepID=A0ACB8SYJ2_9AGAM|nr:hypothetical protein BV25DRAFT_1916896 [Artomyces pyxidatus]